MVGCRALIVDDNVDMAFLMSTLIEIANEGLRVTGVVYSGAQAIEQLDEADPDVIVLDSRMPERCGLDVASDILGINPEQNIVLFSAYLDAETISHAERLGIRECVSKDLLNELPDILRKYARTA
jgi:two-component system response regulator YesN